MFKVFDPDRDIQEQVNIINEANIYDGAIFSGATVGIGSANIKTFNHWVSGSKSGSYYHALYNTHITSSTAVELADITFGFSPSSSYYSNAAVTNRAEKLKLYRLMAKKLLGNENERFSIGGANRDNLIFISLRRSQYKDELKKQSISLRSIFSGSFGIATPGIASVFDEKVFSDATATNSYARTIRGDRADLLSGSLTGGVIYYQTGDIVLVPENCFSTSSTVGNFWSASVPYESVVVSGGTPSTSTFENTLNAIRYRVRNLSFINQTNLRSTYYFCRLFNYEFNYSSNPTFVDIANRIIPTSGSNSLITRTYVTKVGLLGQNNELLAVASTSDPIKKDPSSEFTIKVRLDY